MARDQSGARDTSLVPNEELDMGTLSLASTTVNRTQGFAQAILTLATGNATSFTVGETVTITGGITAIVIAKPAGTKLYISAPSAPVIVGSSALTVTGGSSAATNTVTAAATFTPLVLLAQGDAAFHEGKNPATTSNILRAADSIHALAVNGATSWNFVKNSGDVVLRLKLLGAM